MSKSKVAIIYFFIVCLIGTVGDVIRIYTEDKFGYIYLHHFGVDVGNITSIAFSIRAKNDAHIALSKHEQDPGFETYEIVLGGWNNQKSAIRKCSQCRPMASVDNSPLNGSEFRQFWISWNDSNLRLGNGSTPFVDEMLSWIDPDPHVINYMAVSTGWDSNGTWAFNFIDGDWSGWNTWSDCSRSCAGGIRMRTRFCDSPEPLYGAECDGPSDETQQCADIPCPVNGGWSTWSQWGPCSMSCDQGKTTRQRSCDQPIPQYGGLPCQGEDTETVDCHDRECPINGGWTVWGPWGPCDVTCSNGLRTRIRMCENPQAQFGGLDCAGTDTMSENCFGGFCPVDGSWGEWTSWVTCTVSCGGGQRHHTRQCDAPPPQHGGSPCTGDDIEYTTCNMQKCPVDGLWSSWQSWSACTLSCAGGVQTRLRRCESPQPEYGGLPCDGEDFEGQVCNEHPCPVHGQWSEWEPWLSCSRSCGDGTRVRHRRCDNPSPAHGGDICTNSANETSSCNEEPCPVHGVWLSWSTWSGCSVTCSGGRRVRTRECTQPVHGGQPCMDTDAEFSPCARVSCPVNGAWAAWGAWTDCTAACGGGKQSRHRRCDSPAPAYGGLTCIGEPEQSTSCNEGDCSVAGHWSPWSGWSQCSRTCDEGQMKRTRSCDNPPPQYGGQICDGDDTEMTLCTLRQCPEGGDWSSWGQWTPCSRTCGWGYTVRERACDNPAPKHGGEFCPGLTEERTNCFITECPVNGNWSMWSPWSQCSVSCDGGSRQRVRDCTNPSPQYGGLDCTGRDWQNMTCNTDHCPVDGVWSLWTQWLACSVECGGGYTSRNRTCDPLPKYGGLPCVGADFNNRTCNLQDCHVRKRGEIIEFEPSEAPGAAGIGFIGLSILFTMLGTFFIMDMLTIHRHVTFMKHNLAHCWSRITGNDPPKRRRKKRRTTKRKLDRGASVISNENNISMNDQTDMLPDMTPHVTIDDVDFDMSNQRIISNNINIPHPNDLNKEDAFNTMVRKKLESKYQHVLDEKGIQLQATQL